MNNASIVADWDSRLWEAVSEKVKQRYTALLAELELRDQELLRTAGILRRCALRWKRQEEAAAMVCREFGLPTHFIATIRLRCELRAKSRVVASRTSAISD
ncbi:MAG: hypothetical protein V4773_18075 [Verrucomicrobiota bacterium]